MSSSQDFDGDRLNIQERRMWTQVRSYQRLSRCYGPRGFLWIPLQRGDDLKQEFTALIFLWRNTEKRSANSWWHSGDGNIAPADAEINF